MQSKIKWNKVTPYSRWGAIVLFILIVPTLAFYIGMEFEKTIETFSTQPISLSPLISRASRDFRSIDEHYYPIQSFIAAAELRPTDVIYKLEVDLNEDGYKELLLSNPKMDNARAGLIWRVYINNKDKNYYVPFVADPYKDTVLIDLYPGAMGYGTVPGTNHKGLVSYWKTDLTSGSLAWSWIENGKILQKVEPSVKFERMFDRATAISFDTKEPLKIDTIPVGAACDRWDTSCKNYKTEIITHTPQ